MRRLQRFAYGLALLLISAPAPAFAQSITGSISGSVSDGTGSAVPAARLTLVNAATGAERATLTNESGEFVISSLDPGQYSLSVQVTGFKTLARKGIVLTASERLSVGNLTLELGALEEQVTVTAEGAAVQTASAERATAITSSQVGNLLIYGRTVTSLVALSPGVVDTIGAGARALGGGGGGATNFNVLGNRSATNNFTVDGVTMSAVGGAPNAAFGVAMEAVSEVKVLLSNYPAEFGRLSGSNVQIVTKSGTRDFHGIGMYYMRNDALNANNFFSNRLGARRPRNRYNAVTYSIGGPAYIPGKLNRQRQKLFFFWNHEYLPQKVTGALQYSTMPTGLERAGDFSQSLDVNGRLIPITDPFAGAAFPGNKIPSNRIDLNGQALLGVFPQPNFLDRTVSKGAYNYVTQFSGKDPLQLYTLKLDYNIRSNDTFSATLAGNFDDNTTPNGGGITAPFAIQPGTTHNAGRMVAGHYTHLFSPTLINEVTFGYAQMFGPMATDLSADVLKVMQRSTYGVTASQLNPASNPLNLVPGMSFGGVTGAAGLSYDGRFPFFLTRYTTEISDHLSTTLGSHTLKAGIFTERMRQYDGGWASNFTGTFDFSRNVNNPLDTGNPYSNAVLGVFNTYTEATSRPTNLRYSRGVDWFVQDTWKVARRFTLDYGVRFVWWEPFHSYNNQMAGFAPGLYDPSQQVKLIQPGLSNGVRAGVNPVTGQTYPAALIGFIAPGTGNPTNGMVVTSQVPDYPRGLINSLGPLAAPRVGFAYDPFGDGKTAIRGGFGVFYNRQTGGSNTAAVYSYPLVQTPVVQFDRISAFRSAQGFVSPPSVVAWDRDMRSASVMNASFTIQKDIGFHTVVDIGYVTSLGRHLTWQRNLNSMPLGTRFLPANADPVNPRVPLADVFLTPIRGYNTIGYNEAAGSSNYHSLQVTANRRFARSVEFGVAWTWSKVLDFNDDDFGAVNTVAPLRAWNYGLAGFDRTQVVKVNWLWHLPAWKSAFAPVRAVVNGWQLSGIATFSSGAPAGVGYSQVTPVDLSGTASISPRILVAGDPVLPRGERTFSRTFRTDVFRLPAAGTLGTMSKTLLRMPGTNNFDVALFKNVPIRDRFHVQIRSEFYNAFNHAQFSSFDATARFDSNGNQVNAQFGQYTAARDPRILQLAVRLQF
ncbi:MAG: carboxypeptidase-like regulatory domain-containing protein [Acidobacteria bacterium]|nr:carboxypeptidase-like regulatory domain-containing protein [Acidobacteriota bacterium]